MIFFRTILATVGVLLYTSLFSQYNVRFTQQKTFDVKELQGDFKQMVKVMELHPARYVFTSEAEFEKIIKDSYEKITAPMTLGEFFDLCSGVISNIRCGHTGLEMPDKFWNKGDRPVFPLHMSIVNDSLIVTGDFNADIVRSTHIVKINGKSFDEIVNGMRNYISSDGFNQTWKIGRLNERLSSFLSIYFNFPTEYEIGYRTREGSEKSARLQAVKNGELKAVLQKNDPLTYKVLDGKTALMGIYSFNYYRKDTVTFFQMINKFFGQVESDNIQNLIVDLRGNSGGDPFCAAHLLSYLAKTSFLYYAERYEWCPNLSKPITPKAKAFNGNLYILTDGLCFSTTGHLAALLKVNKIGIIVGDETGGTYTCNDSGKWFELTNTGLKLRMAQQSFKVAAESLPRERGVLPDFSIRPYSDEILREKDVVLEYALSLTN